MPPRPDLSVSLAGIELSVPLMTASGTCGSGLELAPYLEPGSIGALVPKSVSLHPRAGNPNPRLWETPCGLLNSIGLQNEGLAEFLASLPALAGLGVPIVASVAGFSVSEFERLAAELAARDEVAALELNVSCPNVEKGGMAFGTDPASAARVVEAARRASPHKPLLVKLSPNVADMVPVARAAQDAGADALTVMNTLLGMAVDPFSRRPRLANVYGGLSGPAVKPVALRFVHQVSRAVSIPVVGCGGVRAGLDVVEFMLCGASAVQVGTTLLADPAASARIVRELEEYCAANGVAAVRDLVGALETE